MYFDPINADTIAKLEQYDTPTICNIIEVFEIRPRDVGYMNQQIQAAFPEMPPMVGYAATATVCTSRPSGSGDAYASLEQQIEQMLKLGGPTVVVNQDLDVPSIGASFGEVMCSSYQAFGSMGLITSGGGRDLEQVRALKYPVFTGTKICSHAYNRIITVGEAVELGGLKVETGDLLHGDANGVTSIPLEIANEVVDVADEFVAAEQHLIEYSSQASEKKLSEWVDRREVMSQAIETLRMRVSRKA